MRVLVIGGTRFIGRFAVQQLVQHGCDVAVFHRGETEADGFPDIRHFHGDRAELDSVAGALAGFAPEVVLDMVPMTAQDTDIVVAAASGLVGRVVAISSQDVYRAYDIVRGKDPGPPQALPLTEDAELRRRRFPYRDDVPDEHPLANYDKILVEDRYRSAEGLSATILRLPAVYGPHDGQHRTAQYLRRMLDGRGTILISKDLAGWRWTRAYVENVAAWIVRAVTEAKAAGHTFNLGERDAMTERQWIGAIAHASGWDGEVVQLAEDQLPAALRVGLNPNQHLVVDSFRIRRELGDTDIVEPSDAMERTVEWEAAQPYEPIDYTDEDAVITALGR